MGRTLVKAFKHGLGGLRHVAYSIILAHERPDRLHAIEPHQGLELDLAAKLALHQVDLAEARNPPRFDAGDYLATNDPLIGLGILRRRPATPKAADHLRLAAAEQMTATQSVSEQYSQTSTSAGIRCR